LNRKDTLLKMFSMWTFNVNALIRVRGVMMKVWGGQSLRFLRSAWVKWVHGKHAGGSGIDDKYNIIGAGGTMLVHSEMGRMDNIKDMADVLVSLTEITKETKLAKYTNEQRKQLEDNPHFKESELGHTLGTYERDLAHMIQGDAFFNIRKYDQSMRCYDHQLGQMREEDDPNDPDVKVLAMIYGRKGRIELANRAWDRAILNYDRQRSLADEIESDVEWASAYMGLGEGYLGKGEYDHSRVLFEQAMLKCMVISDKVRQAKAYRGIQVSYERLYNPLYAARYKQKAEALTEANTNRIAGAFESLADMKMRLIDTTANMGEVIHLERITAGCINMRAQRIKLEEKIEDWVEKVEEQQKQVRQIKDLLEKIEAQLQEAKTTDKDEMNSALVHEKEQVFEIEELKMRLADRRKKVIVETDEVVRVERKYKMTMLNLQDDLRELDKDLAVEQGALMKQVVKQKIIRCIGLNPSNTAGNEVTGTATGGIEFVCGIDTNNVNLYDIHSGTLKLVFAGDEENRHVGEPLGHTSVITSVLFHDAKIYTGSMDTTIMCWDIEREERDWTGHGHEATVTCLCVRERASERSERHPIRAQVWGPHAKDFTPHEPRWHQCERALGAACERALGAACERALGDACEEFYGRGVSPLKPSIMSASAAEEQQKSSRSAFFFFFLLASLAPPPALDSARFRRRRAAAHLLCAHLAHTLAC
jgi:tetratricopeptide (TPR) repeat protein